MTPTSGGCRCRPRVNTRAQLTDSERDGLGADPSINWAPPIGQTFLARDVANRSIPIYSHDEPFSDFVGAPIPTRHSERDGVGTDPENGPMRNALFVMRKSEAGRRQNATVSAIDLRRLLARSTRRRSVIQFSNCRSGCAPERIVSRRTIRRVRPDSVSQLRCLADAIPILGPFIRRGGSCHKPGF